MKGLVEGLVLCVTSLFVQQYIGKQMGEKATIDFITIKTKQTKNIYLVHLSCQSCQTSIISLMSSRLNSAAYFLYVGCTALLSVDRLCNLEQHF